MEEVNNNRPLVTILILCYNHEDYIAQTLESAFNQDYDNYEIIIRDDNSTDNSQQVIASTINKLQSGNKSIRIFTDFGDENLGLIRSYNKIFKLAQGNIICSLGGDDRAAPIRVRRTVDMFLKYDVDLVASNAFIIDAKSNITSDKFYTRHSRVFSTEFKQEDNCYLVKEMPWNEVAFTFIGGFAISIRRTLLKEYNYSIPTDLKQEDCLFSFLALIKKGAVILDENLIYYRRHGANMWTIFQGFNEMYLEKYAKYYVEHIHPFYFEEIKYIESAISLPLPYIKKRDSIIGLIKVNIAINNILYNHFCPKKNNSDLQNLKCLISYLLNKDTMKYCLKGLLFLLFPRYARYTILKQQSNETKGTKV